MTETVLMRQIHLAVSKEGHRLFRNNVGLFTLIDGRKIRTGLCVGSSDLIGFTNTGRFLAVEIKTSKGKLTDIQASFIDTVNSLGGIAIVCRSVDDAINQIRNRL